MTSDELVCLGFLEALEGGRLLPDGSDCDEMARQGLIRSACAGAWVITSLGQLRLKNLRSTLEFFGR